MKSLSLKHKVVFMWSVFLSGWVFVAGDSMILKELTNPRRIAAVRDRIIVSDYPYAYIYSLDGRLVQKTGGEGPGPGEVWIPRQNMNLKDRCLILSATTDRFALSHCERTTIFDINGKFLLEKRLPFGVNASVFILENGNFLSFVPKKGRLSVAICKNDLKPTRAIQETSYWMDLESDRKTDFFDRASDTLLIDLGGGLICLTRGDAPGVSIEVFNESGEPLRKITAPPRKLQVPDSFRQAVFDFWRVKYRERAENMIKLMEIPRFFPAVRALKIDGERIWAVTWERSGEKNLVLCFSKEGKHLGDFWPPLREINPEQLAPFTIYQNRLYQLVEKTETEETELTVTML